MRQSQFCYFDVQEVTCDLAKLRIQNSRSIPNKLETLPGLNRHFEDQRGARQFFSYPNNINADMEPNSFPSG